MVKVRMIDRKSNALTPSSLRCLSRIPTINMAAGCAHGCAYCYIRGYAQYPGDDAVVVYRNTAEQIERELKRKRHKPPAVYFCPSSDAFMPIPEVLEQSYRTMRVLLDEGVGVQFVTKGVIPDRFFELFAQYPDLVAGQIGLTTLDESLNAAIEPNAAQTDQRLADLGRLIDIGVSASLRCDPLIHGVTDDEANLSVLFAEAASQGVCHVSASYLFLRPAIVGSLRRNIHDADLLRRILEPFEQSQRLAIRGGAGGGTALPIEARRSGLERVKRIAQQHGLKVRICGCKNPDLTSSRCHLTNLTATARAVHHVVDQPSLW